LIDSNKNKLAPTELVNTVREGEECVGANGEEMRKVPTRRDSELLRLLEARQRVVPLEDVRAHAIWSHGLMNVLPAMPTTSAPRGPEEEYRRLAVVTLTKWPCAESNAKMSVWLRAELTDKYCWMFVGMLWLNEKLPEASPNL
jgi:hypothetical protein